MFDRLKDPKHQEWSKAVKERDNYVCQVCGAYHVPLNSHHLNSWAKFIDDRYKVDNGITLCLDCHGIFHQCYSAVDGCTRYQFEEFVTFRQKLLNLAKENSINEPNANTEPSTQSALPILPDSDPDPEL